jgi:hypothetical protein
LAGMDARRPCHLRSVRARFQRRRNQPLLVGKWPASPPLNRCDHLHPTVRHVTSPTISHMTMHRQPAPTRRPSPAFNYPQFLLPRRPPTRCR